MNRFLQARAVEKWAAKIVVSGSGWTKETFAFEYVSIERSAWAATSWRLGIVTSRVRRAMNEGYLVEICVDGNVIIRAKCLVYGADECTVVGAMLARAYQKRIDVVMRRNAVAREAEDMKWAEIQGRNMGAWFKRNEQRGTFAGLATAIEGRSA